MTRALRQLASVEAFELADGAVAKRVGDVFELTAPNGMLLVRYVDGVMQLSPPSGDLELSAPAGRVVIKAALDVEIEAARDLTHKAVRNVTLEGKTAKVKATKLEVESKAARVVVSSAAILARTLTTSAETIATTCLTMETEATKIVERSKTAFRDVSDLAQSRIGRARTIVKDVFTMTSRRTVMTSKEDTAIDGDKILIG